MKAKRKAHLELLTRLVNRLAGDKKSSNRLWSVMDDTGYSCVLTTATTDDIARAILGLGSTFSGKGLAKLVGAAAFQCEMAGISVLGERADKNSHVHVRASALFLYAERDPEDFL